MLTTSHLYLCQQAARGAKRRRQVEGRQGGRMLVLEGVKNHTNGVALLSKHALSISEQVTLKRDQPSAIQGVTSGAWPAEPCE